MTSLIVRYPLDPTGTDPNNLVQGEVHTMVRRKVRAIATTYGAFYSESLKVVDEATGLPLVGSQYYAAELYELPSARYGKEVCAIVIITDQNVSDSVRLDYQALGGEFSTSATAVLQMLEAANLDDRPVEWGAIVGRPGEYPSTHHLHDVGDVYGFEYVVHALDRIRAAIEMGDDISHDVIYKYIDSQIKKLNEFALAVEKSITDHENDTGNPHQVSATQLGVYTQKEIDDILVLLVKARNEVTDGIAANLKKHVSDTQNPHQTTATQVGAYSKLEIDDTLKTFDENVTKAIETAVKPAKDHIAIVTGNPHKVTASDVGAYTKKQVDDAIKVHTDKTDNPHGTTASQVGAYTKAQSDSRFVNMGGGKDQLANFVQIGWDSAKLRCTVDVTDLGNFAFESWVSSQIASAVKAANTGHTGGGSAAIVSMIDTGTLTNSTGYALFITGRANTRGGWITSYVDGNLVDYAQGDGDGTPVINIYAVVPVGSTYRMNSSGFAFNYSVTKF